MKRCTTCGEDKPRSEFYPRKDGISPSCKVCIREARRRYRAEYPERMSEANRRYASKHTEERNAASKAWRAANPEKIAATKARARERDPDAASRRSREWREKNPERERANQKRWYANNTERAKELARLSKQRKGPDAVRATHTAWRRANPDKWLSVVHARRARKRALRYGDVTADAIATLLAAFEDRCAYCRVGPASELDHYVPLKLGGLHAVDNLVPACKPCNASKGAKHPEEWLYSQEMTCPDTPPLSPTRRSTPSLVARPTAQPLFN